MENFKKILFKFIEWTFTIYFVITVFIFIPINNWNYAKENGFLKWILLGEIVPTVQAVAWPYYTYENYFGKSIPKETKDHFLKTMAILQHMSNELPKQDIKKSDIINYIDLSLTESNFVETEKIERNINGFTNEFENMRDGLKEFKKALLDNDAQSNKNAIIKFQKWEKFVADNKSKLETLFPVQ